MRLAAPEPAPQRRRRDAPHVLLHVLLRDAAAVAGAGDLREIDAVLVGDLARGGAWRVDVGAAGARPAVASGGAPVRAAPDLRAWSAAGAAGRGPHLRTAELSTTPSTSPTFTSSPSLRSMRDSTPADSALTSRSILSVSSSTSGSPAATASPSLLQPARDARFDDRLTELRNDDVHMRSDGYDLPIATGNRTSCRVLSLTKHHVRLLARRPWPANASSTSIFWFTACHAHRCLPTGWRCARGRRSAAASRPSISSSISGRTKPHAPMFSGSSCTQTISSSVREAVEDRLQIRPRERVELLDAADGDLRVLPRAGSLDTRST